MVADEWFELHERLVFPVQGLLGSGPNNLFFFAWIIPGGIVVLVLGAVFLPFVRALPSRTRKATVIAALLFVGGAVGMEIPEGAFYASHGSQNLPYNLMVSLEEGLEMSGTILFLYALIQYVGDTFGEFTVRVNRTRPV
jgi:hypothetical protein